MVGKTEEIDGYFWPQAQYDKARGETAIKTTIISVQTFGLSIGAIVI